MAHHPLPFKPLKKITWDSVPGQLLLRLIENKIAVFSHHTAFDSAATGINQQLADALGLQNVKPLVACEDPVDSMDALGSGRYGQLPSPTSLGQIAESLKQFLQIHVVRHAGIPKMSVDKVAIACGSAGSFLSAARRQGCDLFVTGETNDFSYLSRSRSHRHRLALDWALCERAICL